MSRTKSDWEGWNMRILDRSTAARRSIGSTVIFAAACLATTPSGADENPFPGLVGSWSGTGEVRLEGGKTERMQCRAYYRGDGAAGLGRARRCANPSAQNVLRAKLLNTAGSVSGKWEERTFNAGGSVTGKASASKVDLSIAGGGLNATMNVAINGASHSVNITTEGIALKGVKISMARE
ncbi:MAG: hypothetical protein K2Y05_05000 [Hyphomicrobiaceae bacterium]|nr:hypothetical protein [Hyphomicrobiaceae bacterium]